MFVHFPSLYISCHHLYWFNVKTRISLRPWLEIDMCCHMCVQSRPTETSCPLTPGRRLATANKVVSRTSRACCHSGQNRDKHLLAWACCPAHSPRGTVYGYVWKTSFPNSTRRSGHQWRLDQETYLWGFGTHGSDRYIIHCVFLGLLGLGLGQNSHGFQIFQGSHF